MMSAAAVLMVVRKPRDLGEFTLAGAPNAVAAAPGAMATPRVQAGACDADARDVSPCAAAAGPDADGAVEELMDRKAQRPVGNAP
jgi:hypothetical protein